MEQKLSYAEQMIKYNEIIMIDASSIMDPGFPMFIENCADYFIKYGRVIIIPVCVWLELIRHLNNPKKEASILKAMMVIDKNPNLFYYANKQNMSETDVKKALGDSEILSQLILGKPDAQQLLITNDKQLAKNAFELNEFDSVKGHKIKSCFLDSMGNLRRCGCTIKEPMESIVIEKTDVQTCKPAEPMVLPVESSEDGFLFGISLASFLAIGIAVGKYLL